MRFNWRTAVVVCFSNGARARLRVSAGERNDPTGSRRNLHLRGEQPWWIPGESFLLRERRSLWQRQGPGNYFTINLCPPVMDYYLIYYYLLLLTLLSLLLLHHLYARVPALHSTAFNCTTASYEKKREIYINIYILPQLPEQPPSPTISLYTTSIFIYQSVYRYSQTTTQQPKFHSLFTFLLSHSLRSLCLRNTDNSRRRKRKRKREKEKILPAEVTREMVNDTFARERMRRIVIRY